MPAILSDNFNDNVIDTAKWDVGAIADQNLSVTVVETGAQLVITPLSATGGSNRNGLISDSTFDMTQGYSVWKIDQIASNGAVTRCGWVVDANNWIGFEVASTTLTCRKRAASTDSDTTLTYNATTHKYLMLHHSGARVTWYTSPDGAVWTPRRDSVAPGFVVTAVKKFMDAGTTGSVATPGTAIFDDVEIGTLDIIAPFEQLAAFGGFVDLVIDPGFPMNLDPAELAGEPFTIPMSRKYIGPRIHGPQTLHRYHCLSTGLLSLFDVYLGSPNAGSTAIIFNVRIDSVPLWAAGERLSIAPGQNHAQKTDIDVEVTRGQIVEIVVDQVPTIGVPAPIQTILDVVVNG